MVDDGDGKPERPGQPDHRRGVVSGAEDHKLRRRERHVEKHFSAIDRLDGTRGKCRAQLYKGALHRLLFDDGIGEAAGDDAAGADDHPSRDAGDRRDERGGFRALEDRQPLTRDRIVLEPLDEHVHGAAAADAQAPDRIVRQVIAHDGWRAGSDNARRGFGNRRLEATAGQRTFEGTVLAHEHPGALTSVGASGDAHNHGQGRALAGRACLTDDFEEPFCLAPIHPQPGPQDIRTPD